MKIKWVCGKCGKKRGKANPTRKGWRRFQLDSKVLIRCKQCVANI